MQHDPQLRAAARAIYETCYPTEDWAPLDFEQAEQFGSVHYRQAVDAAIRVKGEMRAGAGAMQLGLL